MYFLVWFIYFISFLKNLLSEIKNNKEKDILLVC